MRLRNASGLQARRWCAGESGRERRLLGRGVNGCKGLRRSGCARGRGRVVRTYSQQPRLIGALGSAPRHHRCRGRHKRHHHRHYSSHCRRHCSPRHRHCGPHRPRHRCHRPRRRRHCSPRCGCRLQLWRLLTALRASQCMLVASDSRWDLFCRQQQPKSALIQVGLPGTASPPPPLLPQQTQAPRPAREAVVMAVGRVSRALQGRTCSGSRCGCSHVGSHSGTAARSLPHAS